MSSDPESAPGPQHFKYIVDHVFLPPKLPDKDDTAAAHELALLDAVLASLRRFFDHVPHHDQDIVQSAINTIQNMRLVHESCTGSETCSIDAKTVERILASWSSTTHEYLPLHVSAQNAGILLSKPNDMLRVEVFELSPLNKAVMGTQGRLIRSFPASAVDLAQKLLTPDFIHSLAEAVAKMVFQAVPGMQPQIQKAKAKMPEIRDTTDPTMVTQFLTSYLVALGQKAENVVSITKHTREEVIWVNTFMPWKRSPAWLLIRVTLQLLFRREQNDTTSPCLYKTFMLFFMADILEQLLDTSFESEMLFCMSAKINQRRLKLGLSSGLALDFVCRVSKSTEQLLHARWAEICDKDNLKPELSSLSGLIFQNDTSTEVPALERFIESVRSRTHAAQSVCNPNLEQLCGSLSPDSIPSEFDNGTASCFSGISVETWVASHLDTWLDKNLGDEQTCARITRLIRGYYDFSASKLSRDPESMSIVFLTVMELWVACDKAATHAHPLLREYDPGMPVSDLQALLLPRKADILRLQKVEQYLTQRTKTSNYQSPNIFTAFGTAECFSVRWFERSSSHQALKARIERDATAKRHQKRQEFEQKRARYNKLMRAYDQGSCAYTEFWDKRGNWRQGHSKNCQRCANQIEAGNLQVTVCEWPLPPNDLQARSTVFELELPTVFGHWREVTLYVFSEVLGHKYSSPKSAKKKHTPSNYAGLKEYFQYSATKPPYRIQLLSENKPWIGTHYRGAKLGAANVDQVLLDNALHFSYFDHQESSFIGERKSSGKVQKHCTYRMPDCSATIQTFIDRPETRPDGQKPNVAIASQHNCPPHMSLVEFKALCSIPLGSNILWQNILVQLHQPAVDFQKLETLLVLLQTILRAGVPDQVSGLRQTHSIMHEEEFASALLEGCKLTLTRCEENWQAANALNGLISLLCRAHNLCSQAQLKERLLKVLSQCRTVALRWLGCLREEAQTAISDDVRMARRSRAAFVALICCCTFDMDDGGLFEALRTKNQLKILLQCSIVLEELKQCIDENDRLWMIMKARWMRLLFRSHKIIFRQIVEAKNDALHHAILQAWPAYRPATNWQKVTTQRQHWITSTATNDGSDKALTLHFNLLTGSLLVDGLPLGHLPKKYEQHSSYRALFGRSIVEVMPSTLPGMQFSGKTPFHGYILHFGLSTKGCLRLRAIKEGKVFELLPPGTFQSLFSREFVQDYLHWLDMNDERVEFRHISRPWNFATDDWSLARVLSTNEWALSLRDRHLLPLQSQTARTIAKIIAPLEDASETKCILAKSDSLEVQLPRLQLGFFLSEGTTFLESRQYRGYYVDASQNVGTLIGLKDRLVLRAHENEAARKIIIPTGDASFSKYNGHVQVFISRQKPSRPWVYQVDNLLCRLVDHGHSMESRLWLAYLHALTSFCLPDPAIGKTGTEESITILNSASVRSFDQLSQSACDILGDIARLSPARVYYPEQLEVMQLVERSSNLPFMSQLDVFETLSRQLIEKHRRWTAVFDPGCSTKPPDFRNENPKSQLLVQRGEIRSSTFQVSTFGAENFTRALDSVYESRDTWQSSASTDRVIAIIKFVMERRLAPKYRFQSNTDEYIYEFIAKNASLTLTAKPERSQIQYDSDFLKDAGKFISEHWPGLHAVLKRSGSDCHQYSLWLATLAFADDANMPVCMTLASFMNTAEVAAVPIPEKERYQAAEGAVVVPHQVRAIVVSNVCAFNQSTEARLPKDEGESEETASERRETLFTHNKNDAIAGLVTSLCSQWPCDTPQVPSSAESQQWRAYLNLATVISQVQSRFTIWFNNRILKSYLREIDQSLKREALKIESFSPSVESEQRFEHSQRRFIGSQDIFNRPAPRVEASNRRDLPSPTPQQRGHDDEKLTLVIEQLATLASSEFEKKYVDKLRSSLDSLRGRQLDFTAVDWQGSVPDVLASFKEICQRDVENIYEQLPMTVSDEIAPGRIHAPRMPPAFYLRQLTWRNWECLSATWKDSLIKYGLALTKLQQAKRLVNVCGSQTKLLAELSNPGHTNWRAIEHPETLLLEIESNIMIREVQEQVAARMRAPCLGCNETTQLNMGEGKSSTIIPMVAAHLTRGDKIVRVIVAKPQGKQMFEMLVSKLGGFLNRPVFSIPFSRAVKVTRAHLQAIERMFDDCKSEDGVLLAQPEHILSFKLMSIEQSITAKSEIGSQMVRIQESLHQSTRDILDECDENLSVKFELIYTIGTQRPVDHSPDRWLCVQQVLGIIRQILPVLKRRFGDSIELRSGPRGRFSPLRLISSQVFEEFTAQIAGRVCSAGINGLPIASWPLETRRAVRHYISAFELSKDDIDAVEKSTIWGDETRDTLLLLRGLLAGGILTFAFGSKRWRVNYGVDLNREKLTRVAVPFRAKDNPSPRSEFSHPDVVIVLTSLSYYYSGLSDESLFDTFAHMCESDQADLEYGLWVQDSPGLPSAFRQLAGINLEDKASCTKLLFPCLRYAKAVIDYFLAHLVFPMEMKEFPHKLATSGWDLAELKGLSTTGFSGTNDNPLVPRDIKQLDLEEQRHTNALVLEYLLQPENRVAPPLEKSLEDDSVAFAILNMIISMDPPVRVILDVGAQILELDNLQVVQKWLAMLPATEQNQAALFFDENDNLCVIDRQGRIELLRTSPFADQLDVCVVFLDDIHTRGIDLQLPDHYRALVTLGANLTKDRLVQACMRMRRLGKGQSVIFHVPNEIRAKPMPNPPTVASLLSWAVQQSWKDVRRSAPLWDVQGRRHSRHRKHWDQARKSEVVKLSQGTAREFLEDEAIPVEKRYRPKAVRTDEEKLSLDTVSDVEEGSSQLLQQYGRIERDSTTLQEEQERELAPEIEQERQTQLPAPAPAARHSVHRDLRLFIAEGNLLRNSHAFCLAFDGLKSTSVAKYLNLNFSHSRVMTTKDFVQSVVPTEGFVSDCYQRSVQWILTSPTKGQVESMLIISPFEADELLNDIRKSQFVSLHLYAPRANRAYQPLDKLNLYTVPRPSQASISQDLIVELNLFAGQLYLESVQDCFQLGSLLGIRLNHLDEGQIETTAALLAETSLSAGRLFTQNPVKFLRSFLAKVRWNSSDISRTDMGHVLDYRLPPSLG